MSQSAARLSSARVAFAIVLVSAVCHIGACSDSPKSSGRNNAVREPIMDAGATALNGGARDAGFTPPPAPPLNTIDGGAASLCNPGETRSCNVDLLCTGTATCSSDGQRFGPCECVATPSAVVGTTCQSDSDCFAGARCMAATSNEYLGQGGPAGGYCTFTCTDTSDCTERDPSSVCSPVGPDETSVCIRTCLSKAPEPGEAKCLNRTDVVCLSVVAAGQEPLSADRQVGFCAPRCGSDEDCPNGRLCHRQGGICTDFPAPGEPVGSACQLDSNCDGQACEDRIDGVGTCTASCVLGALSGCGYGASATARDAACVTPVVSAGGFSEGPGDAGLCLELCDEATDCQQAASGFVCVPLNDQLSTFFGRLGACARGS